MQNFFGYSVGIFINDSSQTPAPNRYSFSISDSIYSAFPALELYYSDTSGLALELDNFTQGVPLNVKFSIDKASGMLDVSFNISCRDNTGATAGTPGLNGTLSVKGIHNSFYGGRTSPNKAFKEMTVSDIVKKLFSGDPKLKVEDTKGKIEAYAFDEPYLFTRDILLPQATNGKIRPFCFFRNLANELHFESINELEGNAPSEKLTFGGDIQNDAYNALNTFLPFNEGLEKTLIHFHVDGKILKKDLSLEKVNKTVAADAEDKIPVVVDTRIHHDRYFHRQFNPKVEYEHLRAAFCASAMRSGFFVDKVLGTLPLHPDLVAGKTVEVAVSILNEKGKAELSETFSDNWLIEQSRHSWDGMRKQGETQLILCRSSMKPRHGSIIMDKGFSD
jgi:hypothetical protein